MLGTLQYILLFEFLVISWTCLYCFLGHHMEVVYYYHLLGFFSFPVFHFSTWHADFITLLIGKLDFNRIS